MRVSKFVCHSIVLAGVVFVLLPNLSWGNSRHVTCYSDNYRHNYCRVDTDHYVQLTREFSSGNCREGDTWGYDSNGIWVDRGCSAEFSVGNSGYRDYNYRNYSNGVPGWAVGNFRGKNEHDGSEASISISPGGDVTAVWAGQAHTGFFESRNMRLDNMDFIVKQRADGFETILRSDHRNRVFFHRVR